MGNDFLGCLLILIRCNSYLNAIVLQVSQQFFNAVVRFGAIGVMLVVIFFEIFQQAFDNTIGAHIVWQSLADEIAHSITHKKRITRQAMRRITIQA